jgi:hypothetical protein
MSTIQGSRSEGGYSVNFKVYDQIDNIYDEALVIVFADQTSYGSTKSVIGSHQKFVGYIQKGSIAYDYQNSCVEFTAVSVTEVLKNIEAFSISIRGDSPIPWCRVPNLAIQRALYYYLRWHSTILDCTDFQYTGDDRVFQYWDTDRNSIYDAIDGLLSKGIIAEMVSDRQGKIWVEISPGAIHNAQTTIPVNMSINKQDWMGEPAIEENSVKQVSVLELGGVVFDGASTSTAILSVAPGLVPSTRGKINRIEGFIATSQAQINEVCGDYWAFLIARYAATLRLTGNYNNIDIAPIQQCLLNVSGTDTNRGIEWLDKPFYPTEVDWSYDSEQGSIYPTVKFAEVTNGMKGVTEAIAVAQTVDIPSIPPIDVPTIPPIVIPPFPSLLSAMDYLFLSRTGGDQYETPIVWDTSPGFRGGAIWWPQATFPTRIQMTRFGLYLVTLNWRRITGDFTGNVNVGISVTNGYSYMGAWRGFDLYSIFGDSAGREGGISFIQFFQATTYLEVFHAKPGANTYTFDANIEIVKLSD